MGIVFSQEAGRPQGIFESSKAAVVSMLWEHPLRQLTIKRVVHKKIDVMDFFIFSLGSKYFVLKVRVYCERFFCWRPSILEV